MLDFFKDYNVTTKAYSGGEKTASIDGTGEILSVGIKEGAGIAQYVANHYRRDDRDIRVLDCGAGMGHLQDNLDKITGIECYSFEGFQNLAERSICDQTKMCVCDLTQPITDKRLYKAFDLTTSFEFLEHVPRDLQSAVWDNLEYLSDTHLCSIHVRGLECKAHQTVRPVKEWEAFFVERGYSIKGWARIPVACHWFRHSVFYEVTTKGDFK